MNRKELVSLHNRVIARLAKDSAVTSGDLDAAFRVLDEAAADNIGAARVGVWLFEESNTRLTARDHYDLITRSHKRELCFNAREFPFYFQALEEGRPLVAHQAEFDPRTVELLDGYLEPHGISALLAAPVTVHEELVGALVVEHVGPPRTWTPEEQSFASSIADIVALAIAESERARSELAVAADRARLERIFASTRDTIFTLNADGRFTFVSPAVEHGTGSTSSEVQGRHWHELVAPEDHSRVEKALSKLTRRELPSVTVEYRVLHRDGRERWQEVNLTRMPDDDGDTTVVGVARDITSRRENTASDVRIEERVRDSQKMEAIGRLAGGIAHDFNNLLTVITSGVELGLACLPSDSPARSNLETAMDASGRAASLTKQLRAFGRGQVLDLQTVSLNDIVGNTVELLRRLTRENVQIRASLDQHLWPVRADQTQIEQILVNLAVNASDAMPDGGVLKIQTENVMVGEDEAAGLGELEPGRYIRLTVTDTGSGISDDDLPHIFEPFFTTKSHAGGGLGLAVTFGIVSQHGGHIHAENVREGDNVRESGARFEMLLPALTDIPDHHAVRVMNGERARTPHVLVVEDEPAVRQLACAILTRAGYVTHEAEDVDDALRRIAQAEEPYHLLVTDVVMPGMNGPELFRKALELQPELKALFISGYARDHTVEELLDGVRAFFLSKPFDIATLTEKVRSILAG